MRYLIFATILSVVLAAAYGIAIAGLVLGGMYL